MLLREHVGCAAYLGDPEAQVVWIGNGCRHRQQLYMSRAVDDDLLPYSSSALITQVMHLHGHHEVATHHADAAEHCNKHIMGPRSVLPQCNRSARHSSRCHPNSCLVVDAVAVCQRADARKWDAHLHTSCSLHGAWHELQQKIQAERFLPLS